MGPPVIAGGTPDEIGRSSTGMAVQVTIGLIAILAGSVGILWFPWRLRADRRYHDDVDTDQLPSAISESRRSMGLERSVGQLETHAADTRSFHGGLTRVFRTHQ